MISIQGRLLFRTFRKDLSDGLFFIISVICESVLSVISRNFFTNQFLLSIIQISGNLLFSSVFSLVLNEDGHSTIILKHPQII